MHWCDDETGFFHNFAQILPTSESVLISSMDAAQKDAEGPAFLGERDVEENKALMENVYNTTLITILIELLY